MWHKLGGRESRSHWLCGLGVSCQKELANPGFTGRGRTNGQVEHSTAALEAPIQEEWNSFPSTRPRNRQKASLPSRQLAFPVKFFPVAFHMAGPASDLQSHLPCRQDAFADGVPGAVLLHLWFRGRSTRAADTCVTFPSEWWCAFCDLCSERAKAVPVARNV